MMKNTHKPDDCGQTTYTSEASKSAAILWTGGKDSALALYEAQLLGYHILSLVTFVPTEARFRAHPLSVLAHQAEALGITLQLVEIGEPYRESYRDAIQKLVQEQGIGTLVTGDIAEVDGYPNWIRECCKGIRGTTGEEVQVFTPLWHFQREEVLQRLLALGFKVVFSCVKKPWLTWEWAGRELDQHAVNDLLELRSENGMDICGENGEYHTLVLDGPNFLQPIQLNICGRSEDGDLINLVIPV